MSIKSPQTVKESLYWTYANLAMAHAAVSEQSTNYARTHYIIRSRLYAGLCRGSMRMGSMAADDRVKLVYDKRCCYCGEAGRLSLDHLIPKVKGGAGSGDNLVWSCRSCNSSKGSRDLIEWFNLRGQFPPLLLLRRYLKLAVELSEACGALERSLDDPSISQLPFRIDLLKARFPKPNLLTLWAFDLDVGILPG